MIWQTKILKRTLVAKETLAVYLEKPEGFTFKAGQYVDVTILDSPETDQAGSTRSLSLASAPYESELMCVTRVRDSAFKRVLKNSKAEVTLKVDGPFGSFTLHNKFSRPAVFLMGGIGVTPARSIILQASEEKLPHRIFLFYSSRNLEDAAFLEEFRAAEKANNNFKFIPTLSGANQGWAGEKGRIDEKMLRKYIADIAQPIYYIAGSLAMVNATREMLNNAGVDDDDIRSEEFAGY